MRKPFLKICKNTEGMSPKLLTVSKDKRKYWHVFQDKYQKKHFKKIK